MSTQLVNRSPDLKRLRDEGYDIEVLQSGHLVVRHIPYVSAEGVVLRGTFVTPLKMAGQRTAPPDDHTVWFAGEFPCHADRSPMDQINAGATQQVAGEIVTQFVFSTKPASGAYADNHLKISRYADLLTHAARAIDPTATPKVFRPIPADQDDGPFHYYDTASSRAGITEVGRKLELGKVAIVGLGGTGSYVLDLIAKTPIREIHLFDGDTFSQHNAFRSPGAPSLEELDGEPTKVGYFATIYSKMHRGIIPHPAYVTGDNLEQLDGMEFVFLCVDKGAIKRVIVEALEARGIPFIDVGMGISLVADQGLRGQLRVTTSTPEMRQHVWESERIPFEDPPGGNDYGLNIQIADMNALNAALAVARWKRLRGFYIDHEREHFSTYKITLNGMGNEDQL